MVSQNTVEEQLKQAGCHIRLWGRSEVRELCNILMEDETIDYAVNGYYDGGFALLCITNHRLLLVDRKPMFLTLEDIRFDMISEVDYYFRLLNAATRILTPNQVLVFTSWNHGGLRKLAAHTQQRVIETRQRQYGPYPQFQQQIAPTPVATAASSVKSFFKASPVRSLAAMAMHRSEQEVQPQVALAAGTPKSTATGGLFGGATKLPVNPYNKVPLLSRRRHYPPFF